MKIRIFLMINDILAKIKLPFRIVEPQEYDNAFELEQGNVRMYLREYERASLLPTVTLDEMHKHVSYPEKCDDLLNEFYRLSVNEALKGEAK